MKYFVTPSNPNIFLIGVFNNWLYGFGEKENKLCIYHKSIFDAGDWEEYFVIDVNVVKAECCENGLHVAAGIGESHILIAARDNELTRVFSFNILEKEITAYKMLDTIYKEYEFLNLNLCCKCLMPIIRYQGCHLNVYCCVITPRQYQKGIGNFEILCCINISQHCLLWKDSTITFDLPSPISSNIAVNREGEALFFTEKTEDERIKTLTIKRMENQYSETFADNILNLAWHEAIFFHDNFNGLYCLTQLKRDDDILLQLFFINFSVMDFFIDFQCVFEFSVDTNFPSFGSSSFILSYHSMDIDDDFDFETWDVPPTPIASTVVVPHFITFQTYDSIVTMPLRMLSLAELTYLRLRHIPEPISFAAKDVKLSLFQRIRNLFRRKPKKAKNQWMSINFIKKTLGLPNNYDLI